MSATKVVNKVEIQGNKNLVISIGEAVVKPNINGNSIEFKYQMETICKSLRKSLSNTDYESLRQLFIEDQSYPSNEEL